VAAENTQNFAFDGEGVKSAWESLGRATKDSITQTHSYGGDVKSWRTASKNFFGGVKEAEADYQQRQRDVGMTYKGITRQRYY